MELLAMVDRAFSETLYHLLSVTVLESVQALSWSPHEQGSDLIRGLDKLVRPYSAFCLLLVKM